MLENTASTNISIYLAFLVLVLPLLSFLVQVAIPKKMSYFTSYLASFILLGITLLSIRITMLNWIGHHSANIYWFQLGDYQMSIGMMLNRWAGVMLVIVSFVSLLVNLFSMKYMKNDVGYKRYYAILSLFSFSMIGIVLSDSLLVVFMFWELVGFCSYLLIGHWFDKTKAAYASQKAFIVNRIGDIGFVIALALCWANFKTFSLTEIQLILPQTLQGGSGVLLSTNILSMIGITFFIAAIGKSAQFPLQVWLPDAMEGPTPVSALIHAATMVAAGVYLLARLFFLLDVQALTIIAIVGSITAFMGAYAAFKQYDIKKVLAYSTISQLGYMMVGIGVGAYEASLLHLFTHAFFKAGLFLGAGAIIHYIHQANRQMDYDAQDMRLMGGLRKKFPITFYAYTILSLSLIGLPFFSGFLSKEAILIATLGIAKIQGGAFYIIAFLTFITVAMTAFYVIRHLLLVFSSDFRGKNESLLIESSWTMKSISWVLAFLSLGFLWAFNPVDLKAVWLLSNSEKIASPFAAEITTTLTSSMTSFITILSLILISMGTLLAWFKYKPGTLKLTPIEASVGTGGFLSRLSYNNWFLDYIYDKIFIKPILRLSIGFKRFEKSVIDKLVDLIGWITVILAHIIGWVDRALVDGLVNTSVYMVGQAGMITKSIQGNKIQSYIIWAVLGILIILFLAL